MTHESKLREKEKHRKRRKANRNAKENERLRTASYQLCLDAIAKTTKRKGKGRAHKVKGETMPTLLCANSRCAKGWKHLNGKPMRGESMKVSIIWDLT